MPYGTNGSQTLEDPVAPMHVRQLALKKEIFRPFFLNFPILDRFPLPSRLRARRLVRDFVTTLCQAIVGTGTKILQNSNSEDLRYRLLAARHQNLINEQQFRDNCVSIFLAGHENPQLLLISTLYLLAKNQASRSTIAMYHCWCTDRMYKVELEKRSSKILGYLDCILTPYRKCPISHLSSTRFSDYIHPFLNWSIGGLPAIYSLAEMWLFVREHTSATRRDKIAWGDDPKDFHPRRGGSTIEEISKKYRKVNARAEFIAFHGGRRACLGEKFAILETRITLMELLRHFTFDLDPEWVDRMTPVS